VTKNLSFSRLLVAGFRCPELANCFLAVPEAGARLRSARRERWTGCHPLQVANLIDSEKKSLKDGNYFVIIFSAGIGRSGTFCLVDCCLVLIDKEGENRVSVQDVLLELRKYRMGLIQTHDQLTFSYEAIIEGMKRMNNDVSGKRIFPPCRVIS
jgi:Protein-tyrosine phosphatase